VKPLLAVLLAAIVAGCIATLGAGERPARGVYPPGELNGPPARFVRLNLKF
jgi:hypothetical protein